MTSFISRGRAWIRQLYELCLNISASEIQKELTRRQRERGRATFRWFTQEEAVVAEALANLIIPSDETSPGLDEVCVLDPSAIETLDRMISASAYKQDAYAKGLLSFDVIATRMHGRRFAELEPEQQIDLFSAAERGYEPWTVQASRTSKAWRRLRTISEARDGTFFASQLYPLIRGDCIQIFYTSRVGWIWLEYDGPPMNDGYISVISPRKESRIS